MLKVYDWLWSLFFSGFSLGSMSRVRSGGALSLAGRIYHGIEFQVAACKRRSPEGPFFAQRVLISDKAANVPLGQGTWAGCWARIAWLVRGDAICNLANLHVQFLGAGLGVGVSSLDALLSLLYMYVRDGWKEVSSGTEIHGCSEYGVPHCKCSRTVQQGPVRAVTQR